MIKPSLKNIVAIIKGALEVPDPNAPVDPIANVSGRMPIPIPSGRMSVPDPNKTSTKSISHNSGAHHVGRLTAVQKMQSALQTLAKVVGEHPLPVNLPNEILTSLAQIGNQPHFADGAWGPNTDKALHQAYALAQALVLLPAKFNLTNTIYDPQNLKPFDGDISGYQVENGHITLDAETQTSRSNFLVEHLTALTKLYAFLAEKVPAVSNATNFNEKDQQTIQTGNVFIEYQGKNLTIPLASLTNPAKYKGLLKSLQLDNDPAAEMTILETIINQAARAL